MKQIKILFVGDDSYDMYVKAFYIRSKEMGLSDTKLFATNTHLKANNSLEKFILRAENKVAFGLRINIINRDLISYVKEYLPDLVFLYSTRIIYANTIKQLKNMGILVFAYNNDDPFADYYPRYFWRHYRKSLQYVDMGFVYRDKNSKDYIKSGCLNTEMLRSYYIKERNFYSEKKALNVPSVVFLGHNEKDERQEFIKSLLDEKIEVGIMRKSWEDFECGNSYLVKFENSHELYNELVNAAKIAIVFLSKINNDTYTRRCFEIPATKTMMVAPYTEDLASLFEEDREIVFYRSKEEFVEKIKYYLEHEEQRKQIAEAGFRRLLKDGHEVKDRLKQIIRAYERVKRSKKEYEQK